MSQYYPAPHPSHGHHSSVNTERKNSNDNYVINYDDLEFLKVIGSGAFGEVSEGIYKPKNEKVAIKKLHILKTDTRDQALFRREVETLSKVNHPFLLPFVGYTDNPPYCIVTKFMPNDSLFSALHSDPSSPNSKPLTGTNLTIIAYGIASGMTYLHSLDILHRDLKPQNILLDENLFPIIADFGSSRKTEAQKPMTQNSAGTSNYMAPEFFSGSHYNKEIDVYSYGVMLWEMLTKEVPFQGLEAPQVIYTVVIQNKRPEIPSDTPPKLQQLIESCWTLNPKERPTFEQITKLIGTGEVQFPDNNRQLFKSTMSHYLRKNDPPPFSPPIHKIPRRFDMSTSSSSRTPMIPFKPIPKSHTFSPSTRRNVKHRDSLPSTRMPILDYEQKTLIQKKATQYLQAMNEKTPQFVFDFFQEHIEDNSLPPLPQLWPPFLSLLIKSPPEIKDDVYQLTMKFAQNRDVLQSIRNVENLHEYVDDSTLDIFLYIVDFCPEAINTQVIEQLMNCAIQSENNSNKAIILLYKLTLYQNSMFPVKVVLLFKSKVLEFVNKPGGDIILKALFNNSLIEPEMIFQYGRSNNIQNVIAAYEVNFKDPKGKAENFKLSDVLKKHMQSKSEKLRLMSFEYIRKFAEGAQREPLNEICVSLLQSVLMYGNEEGILLLCNIAARPGNVCEILISTAKKWLALTDNPMLFLNYFLVLISNESARSEISYLTETYVYLSKLIKKGPPEIYLIICYIVKLACVDAQIASFFSQSKICDYIAAHASNIYDVEDLKLTICAIVNLARFTDSKYFPNLVVHFISLLVKNPDNIHACKMFLTPLRALVKQKSTHRTFTEQNLYKVFGSLKDPKGELKEYTEAIWSELNHP